MRTVYERAKDPNLRPEETVKVCTTFQFAGTPVYDEATIIVEEGYVKVVVDVPISTTAEWDEDPQEAEVWASEEVWPIMEVRKVEVLDD